MPTVIPVKFTYAARDLWFSPAGTGAQEGDHVICRTERGQEIGLATGDAREVTDEKLSEVIGRARLNDVLRIATEEDLDLADELARRGEEAMPAFRRHVKESGLDMKPVGVEFLFDGDKAVCYFAAEERVDFRQLVRDLSREFHVRIDMRQIGVREEAAIVGGYGHCGQELCCRRFSTGFDPVSIRMAKEQDLPLNSTKISGACGRLMCCLRYEFEAYRDFKSRAPKRNAVIDTPLGKAKIVEYDTPKERLTLRLENGKQLRVPLADMTASEAARKKSEELGCPCRPDTVTREVLDRLDSPDVQMALAELDRRMGKVPEAAPDDSDIFVDTKRKRRRSSNGSGGSQGSNGPQGSGRGEKHAGSSSASVSAEDAGRRRRKRRVGDGGGQAPQPAAEAQASTAPRRRRHHQAAEGGVDGGQASGRSTSGGRSASSGHAASSGRPQAAKHMRRPGDKGGQAAQNGQDSRGSQPRGMQPSRKKHSQQQGAQGAQGARGERDGQQQRRADGRAQDQGAVDPSSKPRRRRRRGGRGKGGANGANGAGSFSGDSAE